MRITRRTALLALSAAAALSVGCSSGGQQHAGNVSAIRSNPSPSMHTLGERRTDLYNRRTVSIDTNLRMMNQDIERFWMIDRPSNLTAAPAMRR